MQHTPIGFAEVQDTQRPGRLFIHDSNPIWVASYPEVPGVRAEFWQAYRAVKPVPAGRQPWTVDNRRIGTERGFPSLADAIAAATHPA